jgi:hypothetical protein
LNKFQSYKLLGATIKPCEGTHQGRWYVVLPAPTSRWARLRSRISSATRRGKEAGSWQHFCTLADAKAAIADKLGK